MVDILKICNIVNNSVKNFSGERKYLATGDLDRNKIISYNMVTYDNRPSRANQEVAEGNIIVARMKDTVKVLLIDKSCENVIVSTGFMVLKAKEGVYNNYLRILLESSLFQVQKDKLSKGATQQAINNENFKQIKLPLPPLEIQKKIANTLDKAQELIDKRKEQISALDKFLESLFLDMFGDPVSNPKGWERVSLSHFINIKHGFAFKSEYFVKKSEFILLTPGNFYEEGGYKPQNDKQKYYNGVFPSEYILNSGDMLIAMTEQAEGLLGSALFVPKDGIFLHNQRLGKIELLEPFNLKYLFYFLKHKNIRKIIHLDATGTKVRHTSPTKLLNLLISDVPLDLQNQFASIVEKVEAEKIKLEASLKKMEDNFNSIMQRAFKGELF